jgi:Matrixin
MARSTAAKRMRSNSTGGRSAGRRSAEPDPFRLREPNDAGPDVEPLVHIIRNGVRCDTEKRGHETPRGRSPLEIVVDASEGFVPLWAKNTVLRWRFRESSLQAFANPQAAKAAIERLLGEAILAWGDAAPVKFAKRTDAWDFEIVMRQGDDCDISGCVLASAFFPDAGRHKLLLYPKMFTQDRQEQRETLIHEIGHVFGLRHFFAQVSETQWPSEIFGTHKKFSIMNYGADSKLTKSDRTDLKKLYQLAWAGQLTKINGTPIKFVKPFHSTGVPAEDVVALTPVEAVAHIERRAIG